MTARARRVEGHGRPRLRATAWLGLVLTGVAALGGCGASGERTVFARPQVVEPGVRELDGRGGVGFLLVVRRIEIGATDWAVEAEIVNATPVRWLVSRPHFGGTKFGIYAAPGPDDLRPARLEAQRRTTPPLLATRFEPLLPGVLEPNARWSGRFAGPGRIPRDSYLSVAFGRFTTYEPSPKGLPDRLLAVTTTRMRVD